MALTQEEKRDPRRKNRKNDTYLSGYVNKATGEFQAYKTKTVLDQALSNKQLMNRVINGSIVDKTLKGAFLGGTHESIDFEKASQKDFAERKDYIDQEIELIMNQSEVNKAKIQQREADLIKLKEEAEQRQYEAFLEKYNQDNQTQ